ncbi:MAG TPA: DUF2339 domain-containing protein [Allosphingosinicella sp.]|jgi:uncharacterized membrane protein|nr:DUF2339 domain-containing protein [Allosphingosinicella sp.]
MPLLLAIALVGLVLLWTMYKRLAARVAELEEFVGLREEAAPQPPPSAAEALSPAPSESKPPPAPAAARATADIAALVGAPPAEPEVPRISSADRLGGWFERYVGGRLLIWIGGIALAVAGILIVRFSVGLITPPVRLGLAAVLGVALIVGGEIARRQRGAELDPRIAQALVGAGILILYAAPYGALVLYQLISNGTATAAMVAVTAAALLLSLRHGPPTAVMGLAGGFAIPYLVGDRSHSAIPLLVYLALLDVALFGLAGRRGWTWLAAAASLVSFGWMVPLLFWAPEDALAGGVFILGLSLAASLVRAGAGWQLDFLRPAAIGLLQLALLVARNDLGIAAWGLFGALSLASFFLAIRRAEYRLVPPFALAAALVLLAAKTATLHQPFLPGIGLGIALLFAGGALAARKLTPRPSLWTLVGCGAAAGTPIILRLLWPELAFGTGWALVFLAAAAIPLLFGWLDRRQVEARGTSLFLAGATAALLLALCLREILPSDLVAAGWMAVGLLAAVASRQGGGRPLASVALLTAAAATFRAALSVPDLWNTLAGSLVGEPALAANLPAALTAVEALLVPALVLVPLLLLLGDEAKRRPNPLIAVFVLALGTAYVLFKQAYGLSDAGDFEARGFAERMLITQGLFALGWAICAGPIPIPRLDEDRRRWIGISLTALAAARLVWFDMLVDNPLFVAQSVGALPVANWLAPAFLLSAFWLYRARRSAGRRLRSGLWLVLALAALVFGTMLMVRQGFQGPILSNPGVPAAESYGYSLAGLLLSIALLLGGIRLPDKALRLAGLVLLTATALKVFLVDASALEGLLRILSFLGLGVALIGIGKLYTAVLDAEARPADAGPSA